MARWKARLRLVCTSLSASITRYPDVSIELQTGSPQEQLALVLSGNLDAALVAETVNDPRLSALAVYEEDLVIVSRAKHPPIVAPQDAYPRTALVFHPGCPHRARLEGWFAHAGVPIERVVELTSYHAMLGCAAAGMGVAMMPSRVLKTYSERSRLGVHPIPDPDFNTATTVLVWRKNMQPPAVMQFADILLAHSNAAKT